MPKRLLFKPTAVGHRPAFRQSRYRAVVLPALNAAVKALGNYARLHYRLLKPEQQGG